MEKKLASWVMTEEERESVNESGRREKNQQRIQGESSAEDFGGSSLVTSCVLNG